jgi:probable HAF family extracellular repeat protein
VSESPPDGRFAIQRGIGRSAYQVLAEELLLEKLTGDRIVRVIERGRRLALAVMLGFGVSPAHAAYFTGLGDLPGGSFDSVAYGVSADGSVVVGRSLSTSAHEAFRWTSGGGMVGLGFLPGDVYYSEANGVSADGSVVVGTSFYASGQEAFVWMPGAGMQSLQSYLTGLGVNTTGWQLYRATGVSADGLTIVGVGTNPSGFSEAFVANISPVPEPETWLLFAVGFGLLAVARRSSFQVA